ncbi:hypothetical protein IWW45_003675 [Coemansia sp. RSA 485]|nr:hypothetical protein IWW45_003675 [Coemansia sp. RSA 485]
MDISSIIDGIQPASFKLSEQDALFSLFNHPLVHFYQNTRKTKDFMPTGILRQSLVTTLREFPILLGHVQEADGRLDSVVVNKDSINVPEFTESQSSTRYSDLLSAQFNWRVWPDRVASTGAMVTPSSGGKVKLLSVHLTRLADNSGVILFCNIPHFIVDGFGYYEFLNKWACVCKEQRSNHTDSEADNQYNDNTNANDDDNGNYGALKVTGSKQTRYVFDRETVYESLQFTHRQCLPMPAAKAIIETDSIVSRLLASLSFGNRLRIASIGMHLNHGLANWFWISTESIDLLLKLVTDDDACHLSRDEISTYALVAALVDTAFVRAQKLMASRSGPIVRAASFAGRIASKLLCGGRANDEHVLINMVHTRRYLQPLDAGYYFGNPVIIHPVLMPLKRAADKDARGSFVRLARAISKEMCGIDGPAVRGFVDMVCANPSAHARLAVFASAAPSTLTVVDERSYGMDRVDFGDGGPAWVSGISPHMPNMVALFQQPAPMHAGVAIYASFEPGLARLIASDPFFSVFSKSFAT